MTFRMISAGDPAPWFRQRSATNPNFVFDTAAGRYLVLGFLGTASDDTGRRAMAGLLSRRRVFDDIRAAFFAVSIDPGDEREGRLKESYPGIRLFWDFDRTVSRLYGAARQDGSSFGDSQVSYRRMWVVIDPTLRVIQVVPFEPDGGDVKTVLDLVESLPEPQRFAGFEIPPPVLVLPNVFEPEFCSHLIGLYESNGGEESGFMREVDGKTVASYDSAHKRRKDYTIEDQVVIQETQKRIIRRVVPEILKVHNFTVTRMERYIVCCYAAEDGGHFRAHRDNTTKGTAHRRFAVSINLNSEFEGGEVSFPEYGPRCFKPPVGGAVVFSCSLLHQVSKVTSGRRYAFLPFLYDDAAAKVREANNAFLGDGIEGYKV